MTRSLFVSTATALCTVVLASASAIAQSTAGYAAAWAEPNEGVVQTSASARLARMQPAQSPFTPEEAAPLPDPGYNGAAKQPQRVPGTASPSVVPSACDPTFGCGPEEIVCDPTCGEAGCGGAGCRERTCRWCRCGTLADPWTLPLPCALRSRDITVNGWLSGGLFVNAYGDESNGPLGFRNMATGSADQAYIFGERKVDTSQSVFDWGFRADFLFGLDGPDTQAFGDQDWDFDWDSSRDYGSAMPQAYVEFGWNDLTIKGGRFFTPMGYEGVQATSRFFYSTSYMQYYAEPFTHTGALATYKFSDRLSGSAGWVSGWDGGWRNLNGASMALIGINWTPGERFSLAWYISAGRFGDGRYSGNNGDLFLSTLVATLKLTDRLTYVFQNDYAENDGLPRGAETEWYGINQYLLYKLNDCWSVGTRFEWFRDDDGVRVTSDGIARVLGNPGNYYEVTVGLNYKPHANITIRPEVRYDVYDGPIVADRPFNRGNSSSQWSGGFDMIFTF